jgi:type II secretory pathway pseudopilin PulG
MVSEKGFAVIETLIATAVIGLIAIGVLMSLATSAKSTVVSDSQTTAESLARAQMEYVLQQPYDSDNHTPSYSLLSSIPSGYSINATATNLDPRGDGADNNDGLQKIAVSVQLKGKVLVRLEDYKVYR